MPLIEPGYKLKLKSLLQITQAINNNFSRDQLLKIYEGIIRNQTHISQYILYSRKERGLKIEFKSDIDTDNVLFEFDMENYLVHLDRLQHVKFISDPMFFFNAVVPAYHKNQTLAFLLIKTDHDYTDEDGIEFAEKADMEFLQTLTNIVFVAMENKTLAREGLKQEGLKKELELASELQAMLFPPPWKLKYNTDIDAFHRTYQKVGGDYYDYFDLNEDEFGFCIADVSGKGISAALLMSNFQANVRALFKYSPDLKHLAIALNEKVDQAAKGEKFITAFLAKYNCSNRILTYVNAGHNPPVFVNDIGCKLLTEGSIGLGMMNHLPSVNVGKIYVPHFSLLVCYTDGVTELQNNAGYYFGVENLKKIILENADNDVIDLNLRIILKLNGFADEDEYQDDVALLSCRFL